MVLVKIFEAENFLFFMTAAHSMRGSSKSSTLRSNSRSGMCVLVESIRSETPRPRSPHMNNEEPIELAHFPAGHPPQPGEKPKIERDDFPAPPYPYTDPGRFHFLFVALVVKYILNFFVPAN